MKEPKAKINPMQNHSLEYRYLLSPRCGAKTRKQTSCLSPAVHGKKRCRMHGGAYGSGAPKGNQNALKNGYATRDAIAHRRMIRSAIKQSREMIDEVGF